MQRIAITGIGIVSPIGNDLELFEAALRLGRSGVGPNDWHDTEGYSSHRIGRVRDFTPPAAAGRFERRHLSTVDQYALAATAEALARAGLDAAERRSLRIGVVFGSGGSVENVENYVFSALAERPLRPSTLLPLSPDNAGGAVAAHFGLRGPRASIMTACSSGAAAVGYGADLLREGHADVMLVGGMEALSYVTLSGFNALGALSPTINRPFDLNRDGIVIGEAAAVLVLEPLARAKARGAHVFAEFVSYGLAADGTHITAPSPEGDGMARAMRTALRLGAVAPEAIAYINAHGTGTALNDASETAAIRRTFGAHAERLCLSSIKPMIGHTLSAAGAIEAAATVLSLAGQFAPPTLNFETPDPACDLDVVPNFARNLDMEYAMSNSLAFGGNNASLIFRRAEAA